MMHKSSCLLFVVFVLFWACTTNKKTSADERINRKIDSLMALMTREEKIGQLNLPSAGQFTTGQAENSDIARKIERGEVGGLFNIKSVEAIREMQRIAVEKSRLKIPLIFGMDVVHGYETTFPIPLALSCTWDIPLIEQTARIAAQEASADGINWTFSPMVDLCRDPRWGRIAEGSGEDPFLGSEIAKAMVRGYQGTDLSAPNTVLACVKHFALYGASESGRDYNTVDMSLHRMYNEYLPPYKAAVEAGVGSVMTSFNEINGIPATANPWLLTDVLRKQWHFNGFVVSDYTGVSEMVDHGFGTLPEVTAKALMAGVDMDMVSEAFLQYLPQLLKEGKVSEARIDEACRLVLKAKFQLGLFDDPYRYCNSQRAKTEIFTAENRSVARRAAAESFVLLKNEKSILPLQKKGTIALIGPMADAAENMTGTWSVAARHSESVTVLQGLKRAAGSNARILYAKGSNLDEDPAFEERATMFGKSLRRDNRPAEVIRREALQIARQADVIVAALGESAEMTGESASRTQLTIPEIQRDLLNELLKTGKPVVLLLFTGRPLVLTEEYQQVPAILNVWFGGSEAGDAIADVLFGDVNPGGKLTVTFPRNEGQIPIYYAHKNTGRPLEQGKWFSKFRSNYLDVPNEPLFPFGYGLSYTRFTYDNFRLDKTDIRMNDTLKVYVDVTNTGEREGTEVVQLYIRDKIASVTRPVKELKGFQRVTLKPSEKKTIVFNLNREHLSFYNDKLQWVCEPGAFDVMVGGNSHDVLVKSFTVLPE
ncbi:MAG: beta-glucosidase BglX [Cyclobacteriaceae bacterium]|nr:beta-glucosidase BglX [Cyclobacteriaceae bacterium]MDW8332248.1 beta-glucosidase BglX [Cyclobacteriaceae bacterium]